MFDKFFRYSSVFIAPVVTMIVVTMVSNLVGGRSYVEKNKIKSELFNVINNDGDLRAVKNAYENRRYVAIGFFSLSNEEDFYENTVPVSKILEDIRTDHFSKKSEEESTYSYSGFFETEYIRKSDANSLAKLDKIINEHEELNPFEGLDFSQKDNFENVRIKLGDSYALVSGDMEKLSTDLRVKNELVGQYLKDSTVSFWVSIVALLFSLLMSGYQLYMGRDARIKSLLSDVINVK